MVDMTADHLAVLQRALAEVRYSIPARDPALIGSPLLADIHAQVVNALRNADGPAGEALRGSDWIQFSEHQREREFIIAHVRALDAWPSWSPEQRLEYLRILVTPFLISDEELSTLLSECGS